MTYHPSVLDEDVTEEGADWQDAVDDARYGPVEIPVIVTTTTRHVVWVEVDGHTAEDRGRAAQAVADDPGEYLEDVAPAEFGWDAKAAGSHDLWLVYHPENGGRAEGPEWQCPDCETETPAYMSSRHTRHRAGCPAEGVTLTEAVQIARQVAS